MKGKQQAGKVGYDDDEKKNNKHNTTTIQQEGEGGYDVTEQK